MGYYVKVERNVKIYVEDVNPDGNKTILFIHGWPLSHKQYEYQFNVLPGKGYRCIGIDVRGFGKSDKPWDGYCLDRMADDVRCVIEALKLNNYTLAGHSYGGAIAIRYMARYGGKGVSKLALFGAAAPSLTRRPYFPYGQSKEQITQIVEDTLRDRPNMLRGLKEIFFFQNISSGLADWFFDIGLDATGYSTAKVAESFRDEELFSDLGKIHVPTLILHGIHDQVCYPELAVAQKDGIPNAKLVWFQFSGHSLFYEEKDKFNDELMEFIECE